MNRWLKLFPADANEPQLRHIRGADVYAFPSPHDVPERLRGYIDSPRNAIVIEFKYPDEEPKAVLQLDESLLFTVGRNSKRFFGLEICPTRPNVRVTDLTPEDRRNLLQQIEEGIEQLERQNSGPITRNYEMAKNAIVSNSAEILGH
jgi:hypothetical protein